MALGFGQFGQARPIDTDVVDVITGRGLFGLYLGVTWPHQVSLGAHCQLEPGIYFKFDGIYEPGPRLLIGEHVFIGAGCEFNFRREIVIGATPIPAETSETARLRLLSNQTVAAAIIGAKNAPAARPTRIP